MLHEGQGHDQTTVIAVQLSKAKASPGTKFVLAQSSQKHVSARDSLHRLFFRTEMETRTHGYSHPHQNIRTFARPREKHVDRIRFVRRERLNVRMTVRGLTRSGHRKKDQRNVAFSDREFEKSL